LKKIFNIFSKWAAGTIFFVKCRIRIPQLCLSWLDAFNSCREKNILYFAMPEKRGKTAASS